MNEQPRINRMRPIEIKLSNNIFITVFENGDVYVSTDADVHVVGAKFIFVLNGRIAKNDDDD